MYERLSQDPFYERALEWVRAQQPFSTRVLPTNAVDPERRGWARVGGFFRRPSSMSNWMNGSALGVVLCILFAGANSPALGAATTQVLHHAAPPVGLAAASCLAVGEAVRRRNRSPGTVELRTAGAPVSLDSLDTLASECAGGRSVILSESALSEELLEQAQRRGIECYVQRGSTFERACPGDTGRALQSEVPPSDRAPPIA